MTQYRVKFFNDLINSNGHEFRCLQRTVVVDEAKDAKDASEKAKREFSRLENIPNWRVHAHFFEVEITPNASAHN
jgi:hypothetical protein